MTDVPVDSEVRDEKPAHRFVLEEDGEVAELVYRMEPGRLFLVHTGVPDEIAGSGIGARLVRAALARARAEHLTVVPWCPYARRWIREHPEAVEGIELDWKTRRPSRGESGDA
jgi:predicted GNAT family acetyltransferase